MVKFLYWGRGRKAIWENYTGTEVIQSEHSSPLLLLQIVWEDYTRN